MSWKRVALLSAVMIAIGLVGLYVWAPARSRGPTLPREPAPEPGQTGPAPLLPSELRELKRDGGSAPPSAVPLADGRGELVAEEQTLAPVPDAGELLSQREVTHLIFALAPLVNRCLADQNVKPAEDVSFELVFDVVESYGQPATLSRARVKNATLSDPYLDACLEDSPLDTQHTAQETGSARVTAPFRYSTSRR